MKRNLAAALLSALLLLTAGGCSGNTTEESSEEPAEQLGISEVPEASTAIDEEDFDSIVASYGEYSVSLAEYSFFYRIYQAEMEYDALTQNYTPENMSGYWNQLQDDGKTNIQYLEELSLNSAKEYNVLYNLGVKHGAVAPAEVLQESDAYIDGFLANLGNDEGEFLKMYKLKPTHIKEMYHRLDLADQYRQDVMNAIELTEEEIRASYEESQEVYDRVTVRHILIESSSQMTEEEQAQAKEKAEDILKQLEGGADFGELVAEHTADIASIETNGEYTFGRGEMVTEFENWAYEAEPGDRDIVKTLYGYHVMEMIGTGSYEDIKDTVAEELRYVMLEGVMQEDMAAAYSPDWSVNREVIDLVKAEDMPMYM